MLRFTCDLQKCLRDLPLREYFFSLRLSNSEKHDRFKKNGKCIRASGTKVAPILQQARSGAIGEHKLLLRTPLHRLLLLRRCLRCSAGAHPVQCLNLFRIQPSKKKKRDVGIICQEGRLFHLQ